MGEGEEHGVVKIADFGLARIYQAPLKTLYENGVNFFFFVVSAHNASVRNRLYCSLFVPINSTHYLSITSLYCPASIFFYGRINCGYLNLRSWAAFFCVCFGRASKYGNNFHLICIHGCLLIVRLW